MAENVNKINFKKVSKKLLEKSEPLKTLDDEIIEITGEEDVDHINSQVDSSSKQTVDITEASVKTENLLSKQNRTENLLSPSHISDISLILSHNLVSTNNVNYHVKVPKLVINKFDGNVLHFMSFWEHFKAAIPSNVKLNNIDKFNYLIYYLKDDPLDTNCCFTLSSEN